MRLNEIFNRMEWYINSDLSTYIISMTYKDKFKESFKLLWDHITTMEKDEPVDNFDPKTTPTVVEECVNYLIFILYEQNANDMLKKFINDYIFVTFNWNNNIWKDDNFNRKLNYLNRFINDSLTAKELISVSNKIVNKLSDFKNWLPPAFELSKHYYNLIKEA